MRTLYIDLGNTRLKYWLIEGDQILASEAKEHLQAPSELLMGLAQDLKKLSASRICVSSVLGSKSAEAIAAVLSGLEAPFEFAQVLAKHPRLTTAYDPAQLGVDRWLQLLGASCDQPQIVAGAGTALTIDILDKRHHSGGFITSGIRLTQQALRHGTRQIRTQTELPNLPLTQATSTSQAVASGALLSAAGAISFCAASNPDHRIVLTGGDAPILKQALRDHGLNAEVEPDLMLQGLKIYFSAP